MTREVTAPMGTSAAVPPAWTSVLAVIAHPDEASSGLGTVLDAFVFAGAKVDVLCLTHGQAWTLQGAPGDLATLRGAELASTADVLGPVRAKMSPDGLSPIRAKMQDWADGTLCEVCQSRLAAEVVAAADSCHPDGLLVLDTAAVTGHFDHVAASSAALLAADTLDVPVLGWALSETVAAQLKQESPANLIGRRGEDIDLRMSFECARQRLASHVLQGPAVPGSPRWRLLGLLADNGSLRWLRPPGLRRSRPLRSSTKAANHQPFAAHDDTRALTRS
jgi:LmbE family N-acetylglucosaminyl deacetylase